jgi:hypothetical protein
VDSRPFSASADTRRNSLDAEFTLAQIDLYEDLHELWRTEEVDELKVDYAKRYREILGFEPGLRDALVPELEALVEDGSQPVEEVIAGIRRRTHANGWGCTGGAADGNALSDGWASWL